MRQDTVPGSSDDRVLHSNHWTVRETLLQSILNNWDVFQDLWDRVLGGKIDSEIRDQVIRVLTQKQSFNLFFWIQLGVFLMHTDNFFYSTIHTRHFMKANKLQLFFNMFLNIARYERGSFHMYLKKMTPNYRVFMRERKLLHLYLKLRNSTTISFIKQLT